MFIPPHRKFTYAKQLFTEKPFTIAIWRNIFTAEFIKHATMDQNMTTNNRLFIDALIGVLLLIAAMAFTMTNFSSIMMMKLSSSLIAGVLSFSSFSLLYKAIKNDRHRLDQQM